MAISIVDVTVRGFKSFGSLVFSSPIMAVCFNVRPLRSNLRTLPVLKSHGSVHVLHRRLSTSLRVRALRQRRKKPYFTLDREMVLLGGRYGSRVFAHKNKLTPIEIVEDGVTEDSENPTPKSKKETPLTFEDYWSPVVDGVAKGFKDKYGKITPVPDHDGTDVFENDSMLWDHQEHFRFRWNTFRNIRKAIDENEKGMENFTRGKPPFFVQDLTFVFRI